MVTGKIIGGSLGFLVAGPLGVLIGLYVGHQFDKGLIGLRPMSAEDQARTRDTFFDTLFSVLGHLAKADGRITPAELLSRLPMVNYTPLSSKCCAMLLGIWVFLRHCLISFWR